MKQRTVKTMLDLARQRLSQTGCESPRLDAELLLAHVLGQERTWLYVHPLAIIEPAQEKRFLELVTRREQREPVAYITGHKEFFGLEFLVNRHVLIPRPETELLVETVIQLSVASNQLSVTSSQSPVISHQLSVTSYQSPPSLSIADIGAGSGCIAIALAKQLPGAILFAVDRSPQALQVAQTNAARHGVAGRIHFFEGDLLQPLSGPFDFIVSNPPYISRSELATTAPEVRLYEPKAALEGGADGLEAIRRLLPQAREKLKPDGALLVEIGAAQGEAVTRLAADHFPRANILLKQDLAGLDRVLVVRQL